MKTKKIVITGGPGTGKTYLINHLEQSGYPCIHEISRAVILDARKAGIDQLFLEDPILFSRKLLEGREKQYRQADSYKDPFLFYDRGMPDITAYMDYLGTKYDESFSESCNQYRYDAVFLLPPWKEIYTQDNERYESFAQAETIYRSLLNAYREYGYQVHIVPFGTVEERKKYILQTLRQLF